MRSLPLGLIILLVMFSGDCQAQQRQAESRLRQLEPTFPDVAYGPHERHRLDLWLVESEQPAPLLICIHGGGFRGGDKSSFRRNSQLIEKMRDAGIAVAAINYRLTDDGAHPFPIPMQDGARAVQFLRANSAKYHLDTNRFAATGGSAGGCMSMWLGFHDDLADPNQTDPVLRESTRLCVVAPNNGQSCLHLPTLYGWFGVPTLTEHPALRPLFGIPAEGDLVITPELDALMRDASPITHLTKDDPPCYMTFGPNVPVDESSAPGLWVHHPMLGFKLQEQMKALELTCEVEYRGGPPVTAYAGQMEFLIAHLTAKAPAAQQSQNDPFDRWDANRDGKVSRDELPEPLRGNFDRVDTDDDGFISREEHRAVMERGVPRRQPAGQRPALAGTPIPDSVELQRDLPYAETENPRQRLDLLLPRDRKADQRLPVVVFIHGGAWRAGDKSAGLGHIVRFVASGEFAGVTVGYRLSNEAQWPEQIHDCKAAIRWVRAHADQYGLDPERIAVWGSSAGGHLVAMLGTSGNVAELEGQLGPHPDQSSRVTCVVDFFGPTDFLSMNANTAEGAVMDHEAADSPESLLVGGPVREHPDRVKSASPLTWVTEDDPPFLIVHGTADPLVAFGQSELLRDALQKVGGDVTLVPVTGAGHGNFGNPQVTEVVRLFLKKHLQGQDVEIPADAIPQGP